MFIEYRTNNDMEGWHNCFNSSNVTHGAFPFYKLITDLYAKAADNPAQIKLVAEGKAATIPKREDQTSSGQSL